MADTRLHLAIIVGSTRDGRLAPAVAEWFAARAKARTDLTVDVIDLADVRVPAAFSRTRPPEVDALGARLAAADAFVVITPEYNHSFPAPLKSAIDWFSSEWRAKPIGFVSYGGVSGGLRAVEQLRLVFAELHAMTVRDTVSFHNVWTQVSPEGRLLEIEGARRAAFVLLDQIAWWADALKDARERRPYAA